MRALRTAMRAAAHAVAHHLSLRSIAGSVTYELVGPIMKFQQVVDQMREPLLRSRSRDP
eukprot:COSAG01_NODE_7451_length_3206_cov_4.582877_1_plen_59_part_00